LNTLNSDFSPVWTIGFMSGTSLDAVDAAIILTDGERVFEFGPVSERTYTDKERTILADAVQAAIAWNWDGALPSQAFQAACDVLTKTHKEAFKMAIANCDKGQRPVLAGIHGQTVLHRAPRANVPGRTLQIVDELAIAKAFGIPVAFDFRSDDVSAGGQGAPLAPIYHQVLCHNESEPVAVLNLGGVANLTFVSKAHPLLGFDCGPANGPIDEWIEKHNAGRFDKDGALARSGCVDEGRLADWMNNSWFDEALPKSLDRFDFNARLAAGMSLEDGAATLTALCASGVARGLQMFPERVSKVIVCGGGRRNPALMNELKARCPCEVWTAEDMGWRGDSIEAEAFAVLAVRTKRGLPISFPGTTGIDVPLKGGRICVPALD
jgi:anhydro-N-acetylmuramic acid kinase